ncbi:NUDIX domain-containing protein [Thermoflexus sp.]|uniref:NUDIX hydrolase n=1 Tax=Thermoflexus sp. TaxID=1969742 RepID=UPI0025E41076|nr:NUDIX domain-containing protein [Thermoflexus sp.]MDW8065101.1 NUDIX domain-containing protein [Anaerolineae bacterium]MCS6964843.1 NUDIX domain-containing protein [Thermoflexus sp.]MCS7351090.1 NUDIX domain-containing protein [Thermoflexus sp.]MCX7690504.1 NUDIX domain-containing protein [Thermoflexus sp.]MDW8180543.1 NUDIX domain-containing protein [Anaerolineae bacterium]
MASMDYVRWLRARIGPEPIWLVYATALIVNEAGHVLLQRRADFEAWGLPGGVMEPGESLLQALHREVEEETGLTVQVERLIGLYTSPDFMVHYPNGDTVHPVTACFLARPVGGALRPDGRESLALQWFPQQELPPLPRWYAAMIADYQRGDLAAAFRSGAPGRPLRSPGETIWRLRERVGPATLVVPAASAVIFNERGEILLHRRSDNGRWGLPGGIMEIGERIDQTLVREVAEETGLQVEPLRLVGLYTHPAWTVTYPNGDRSQPVVACFEARITGGRLQADGIESLEVGFFPRDRLDELLDVRWRVRIEDAVARYPYAVVM